ncbi:MAG: hypothetical protein WC695_02705 [Candidatus Omnitrophota bacterium]
MLKISRLAVLVFFLAIATVAYAHPPTDIAITFDPSSKVLKAVITHPVSNVGNHFIAKVDVGLNGKEVIEHKISRQDNNSTQTVSYLLPDVKPGDTVSVEAYCSISGKLVKEIKIIE